MSAPSGTLASKRLSHACVRHARLREQDVDWDQVVLAPRLRRCTSHDAKVQWFARDRPGLNHGRWTAAETSQLMDLARELQVRRCVHGASRSQHVYPAFNCAQGYRWDLVAKRLGTGRTPFQCFARYQQEVKKLYVVAADIARGFRTANTHGREVTPRLLLCAELPPCRGRRKKTLL